MASAAGPPFTIEALGDRHDRTRFSCGASALDRYLRAQASQDARRRVAACFVLLPRQSAEVIGFYTLSAMSIALAALPPEIARRLPRYPGVPATLLGRLAVDRRFHRRGLGRLLMLDAFARCLRAEIATFAVVVDAKDDAAVRFYAQLGLRPLTGDGRRLFLPMTEIAKLLS